MAIALLRLMASERNREQLTRLLGFTIDPTLPHRLAMLLQALEEQERAKRRRAA